MSATCTHCNHQPLHALIEFYGEMLCESCYLHETVICDCCGERVWMRDCVTDGDSTINLFEQNMFAVRAEIEVGFRCDTTVFNKLTGTAKTGS